MLYLNEALWGDFFLKMKPRILVVDDDREIFEILVYALETEGFELVWAKDGEEFHQKAVVCQPHLILLDIMLGAENGPEIYKRLLAQGLNREIPVIFISSLIQSPSPLPIQPGRLCTMHAKPFKFDRLLGDIRTMTSAN